MKVCGVYAIINKINGKRYVGSSVDIKKRWRKHKYLLKNNNHSSSYLQNSWIKYSEKNFEFVILEECAINKIIEKEQHFLDLYKSYERNNGYNNRTIAERNVGLFHSEETKKKIGLAGIGNKYAAGYKMTNEHKKIISNANKNKPKSKEHRDAISQALKGRVLSEEHKRKLSVFRMGGGKLSEERKKTY